MKGSGNKLEINKCNNGLLIWAGMRGIDE